MGSFKNFMWTFWIGFVAGVAPFVALNLLPGILDPRSQPPPASYGIIAIVGALVGFIIAILYSRNFEQTPPRDIFFTALGIPALLMATVSNLSTRNDADQMVASAATVSGEVIQIETPAVPVLEEVSAPPAAKPSAMLDLLLPREARAQTAGTVPKPAPTPRPASFLVVLASYGDSAGAANGAEGFRRQRLATERFVRKDIRIFHAGRSAYYVSYTGPLQKEEALRVYRLVKISDPKLSPTVLSLGG